ncbi:Multicopper oxidase [hydrothermal vent metagenome]|uniref:Multicopper oxidase n=1 Tax=hydrothermal vent metagenome TaxID=652676 RepID=A0A1W1EC18_9ZZZZ
MKRRDFLALSSVTALWIITGCGGGSTESSTPINATKKILPIPELLKPNKKNGVQHYDLNVEEAQHTFFDGIKSDTYAISSTSISNTYLGPTLLMQNGDKVSINYTNKLRESITMHGHGMHVPPSMDGTAHQPFAANQTWSATYTVKQKACTNWYHPHTMDKTASQVYQGLAGLIIIEDTESKTLNLPKRYGVDDIPLVLQDRNFINGQIDYDPSMMDIMRGYTADTFITNGAIEPTLDVEAKEIRFRILNGSNSTVYTIGFEDGRSFKQIATDNAFLEAPVSLRKLTLSPAERAEIVVDLSNAKDTNIVLKEYNYNKTFLNINVTQDAVQQTRLPNKLTTLEKLNPIDAVRTRPFVLSGMMGNFSINGKSMNINVINENVPLGDIEIWEITNDMMVDHNFHIHATHFMLIERNGSSSNVSPNEKGYKDVVYIPANESVKFIVKMTDYADNTVPYMYHCHFLEHEDAGMMGQFIVT